MQERRKYSRYDTELKLEFAVHLNLETKINFWVQDKSRKNFSPEYHQGLSQNVSAEGMCFISQKLLEKGDCLLIDLYLPGATKPISMEGIVCWSHSLKGKKEKYPYTTGVKLLIVDGKNVELSIFKDTKEQVVWSAVLESVFGTFKDLALQRKIQKI